MQVHIEDLSPVEKKLDVEIPWDRVREKLDAAYRELGKGVQLKGFRKGKVPRSVLERMFGRQVQVEVAKELVQESIIAAAEEHRIEAVAEPVVEEASIKPGESFRYSARVEVRSPIELGDIAGVEAMRRPVSVADEEVDRALEMRRREHTEYKTIEGRATAAISDVLIVAVKGKIGDKELDRELHVDLSDREREPLPGMAAALVGLPLDAKDHEVSFSLPEDASQKELGKTVTLQVTVKEAREKRLPTLDDEFAKDTGDADTLDELKKKVREALESMAKGDAEREVREAVLKGLVKRFPIPVAPKLVEKGIDSQLERARMSLAMQGIDLAKTGIDLGGMRDRLREGAADEVRGQLLLEAVAEREQLQVTDEDVAQRVSQLAAAQGKPAQKIRAEMERDGSLGALRWRLRQEKALDLVVSRATITEGVPAAPPAENGAADEPAAEPAATAEQEPT